MENHRERKSQYNVLWLREREHRVIRSVTLCIRTETQNGRGTSLLVKVQFTGSRMTATLVRCIATSGKKTNAVILEICSVRRRNPLRVIKATRQAGSEGTVKDIAEQLNEHRA